MKECEGFETDPWEGVCQDIRNLLLRGHVVDGNGVVHNMRTKTVESNREVFHSRTSPMIGCDFNAIFVVFQSFADDNGGTSSTQLESAAFEFNNQLDDSDDFAQGRG